MDLQKLKLHKDSVDEKDKVLIIDDLIKQVEKLKKS